MKERYLIHFYLYVGKFQISIFLFYNVNNFLFTCKKI